jgi:hypothetical protein
LYPNEKTENLTIKNIKQKKKREKYKTENVKNGLINSWFQPTKVCKYVNRVMGRN